MDYLRRKPLVYHEDVYSEDFEIRSRRRLSKPLTNSANNLSSTSLHQLARRKSMARNAEEGVIPLSPNDESREIIRSILYTSASEVDLSSPKPKRSAVAMIAAKFETTSSANTSTYSLVSPKVAQHSMSRMLSQKKHDVHRPSISSLGSTDRYGGDLDLNNVSPSSSLDQIGEDPAPPARRAASFTPGTATRMPSFAQEAIVEENESAIDLIVDAARSDDDKDNVAVKNFNSEDDWKPPPQNNRPVTPMGLEYASIGGLGLGSLRVVNGASSPAPSEVSKHSKQVWQPTLRRDTSSVYESDFGTLRSRRAARLELEDGPLSEIKTVATADDFGHSDMARAFSFRPRSEARFNLVTLEDNLHDVAPEADSRAAQDTTSAMAEEYMATLPKSPFASPPTTPEKPATLEDATLPSEPASDAQPCSPLAQEQEDDTCSLVTSGSVVRHDGKVGRRSFVDETLGSSPEPDRSSSPSPPQIPERRESPASFYSVPESGQDEDEHFKSAVELQPRARSRSPQKSFGGSPLKTVLHATHDRSHMPRAQERDSGYSSNASLDTLQHLTGSQMTIQAPPMVSNDEKRGGRLAFLRKEAKKPNPVVLIKPTPPTTAVVPVSAAVVVATAQNSRTSLNSNLIRSSTDTAASLPASPTKPQDKQRKKLVKSRRKSTVDTAGELVVQRIASVQCFDLPPITSTARANLAMRSETIPELERTYKNQDHTNLNHMPSILSLAQPVQEVRFPSPEPDDGKSRRPRSRSRSRRRSISRPRSWFGGPKNDKDQSDKHAAATYPVHAALTDLGSVQDLLGHNPYDLAKTTPRPVLPPSDWKGTRPEYLRSRTSPSNITTNVPHPRPMMDDATAARMARNRRLSSQTKTPAPVQRQSFDDRGGIPGKLPHSPQLEIDAPPMPAMPSAEEISRRYSRRFEDRKKSPSPTKIRHDVNMAEPPTEAPPLPPPHSPQPSYVDQRNYFDNQMYELHDLLDAQRQYDHHNGLDENASDDIDDFEAPAPPPPSHSPRPMDITEEACTSREVSWTAQANAWKARRQSAGEALRGSFGEVEHRAPSVRRKPLPQHAPALAQTAYEVQRQGIQADPEPPIQYSEDYPRHNHFGYQPQQYSPVHEQHYASYDRHHNYDLDHGFNNHSHQHDQPEQRSFPAPYAPRHFLGSGPQPPPRAQTWTEHDEWQQFRRRQQDTHQTQQPYNYYAEYNARNVPQPQLCRAQTFDDYSRPQANQPQYSRSASRHSHHSRKSLAEELHPEIVDSSPVQHSRHPQATLPPQIGRYSGGLEYNYDSRSREFVGSSGTRSVSTARVDAPRSSSKKRSSWLDMEAYGVDLADVPVMSVPVGATGDRMRYG